MFFNQHIFTIEFYHLQKDNALLQSAVTLAVAKGDNNICNWPFSRQS